jgi:hypothetical protein
MSTERKVRRKVVNFKEADFETYSLQGAERLKVGGRRVDGAGGGAP